MELRLNGEQRSADVDPRMLLVEALRDAFGAHGPKIGCLTGGCGACTVRVDGAIVKSCLKLAVAAEGADVQTLEGLADDGGLSALQQAFWDSHAFQCGYCLSGMRGVWFCTRAGGKTLAAADPMRDRRNIV